MLSIPSMGVPWQHWQASLTGTFNLDETSSCGWQFYYNIFIMDETLWTYQALNLLIWWYTPFNESISSCMLLPLLLTYVQMGNKATTENPCHPIFWFPCQERLPLGQQSHIHMDTYHLFVLHNSNFPNTGQHSWPMVLKRLHQSSVGGYGTFDPATRKKYMWTQGHMASFTNKGADLNTTAYDDSAKQCF